ncbi:MAG: PRC-barrel domain-containing protein [Christensenellales bacterium]|jgi:uncharacterized protein YrrD
MKRIDQICGLAVIDAQSGAKIGDVTQVVLSAESRKVAGVDISPRGFISAQRFIEFGDIEIFGDVSILIRRSEASGSGGQKSRLNGGLSVGNEKNGKSEKTIKSLKSQRRPKKRLELGQKVYLTDGSDMGWFTNALINESSGDIHSLEVSEGYIDDLVRGRRWISEFSCGRRGITALFNGRS